MPGKVGPKGPIGPKGVPGPPGARGPKGESGDYRATQKIAFSASRTINHHLKSGQPIRFDHVITNANENYQARTSMFTCKVPGLYFFTYHVLMRGGDGTSMWADLCKNNQVRAGGGRGGRAGRCRREGGDPGNGGWESAEEGRGSCSSRELRARGDAVPTLGSGGRTPKSARRPGEGGSRARAAALGARAPKKREAGFGPGQFVHLGQSRRRKRPPGCGMLISVGSLSDFARNWAGWGSQKWACQRDKREGERPGPKGKIEGERRSESERRAHPGPRQDHGIRGRQARINSQVVKFEMQKLWFRFQS